MTADPSVWQSLDAFCERLCRSQETEAQAKNVASFASTDEQIRGSIVGLMKIGDEIAATGQIVSSLCESLMVNQDHETRERLARVGMAAESSERKFATLWREQKAWFVAHNLIKYRTKPSPPTMAVTAQDLLSRVPPMGDDKVQATQAKADSVQGEAPEATAEAVPAIPAGFLGGKELADALGIQPNRQDAFFQKLMRERPSFGNDCYEILEPPPNSPKFLYRADAPQVRELASKYKSPKSP